MRIAIASDHAAYELKALLADWLRAQDIEMQARSLLDRQDRGRNRRG